MSAIPARERGSATMVVRAIGPLPKRATSAPAVWSVTRPVTTGRRRKRPSWPLESAYSVFNDGIRR